MQQVRFEAEKRDAFGKGASRSLRRNGYIPAILYGRQREIVPLQVNARNFHYFLRSHGENVLINLEIPELGSETVIIKEIQRDPVKEHLVHADFIRVSLDEPVTSVVPIVLVGSAPGVREGGVVEFQHRELTVTCLPTLIPEEVSVDISRLGIQDGIHVSDLSLPEGITIEDDPHMMIVMVSPPRVETEAEKETEADLEAEQQLPEVISRKREDEEK